MANTGSADFADEVARVRNGKRHAIANTPLASVPLDCGRQWSQFDIPMVPDRKRTPVAVKASPPRYMGYAKRVAHYDQ